MSDWLDELRKEKKRQDAEMARKLAQKKRKRQQYEQSYEFKSRQADKIALGKFYHDLCAYISEASQLTGKWIGNRKLYSDNCAFVIEGEMIVVKPWVQGNLYYTALLKHRVFTARIDYRANRGFFNFFKSDRNLYGEFQILCEIEEGTYADSDKTIKWNLPKSSRDKIISVSEINTSLYEKIAKWLILGKKFL